VSVKLSNFYTSTFFKEITRSKSMYVETVSVLFFSLSTHMFHAYNCSLNYDEIWHFLCTLEVVNTELNHAHSWPI